MPPPGTPTWCPTVPAGHGVSPPIFVSLHTQPLLACCLLRPGRHLHSPWRQWSSPRGAPRPPLFVQGTQLRCPRRAWPAPLRGGLPVAGGGQLVPALFKGQQFSTAGEGRLGVSRRPPPPEHAPPRGRGSRSETSQHSTGSTGGAFVSLARGAALLPQTPPRAALLTLSLMGSHRAPAGQAFSPPLSKCSMPH